METCSKACTHQDAIRLSRDESVGQEGCQRDYSSRQYPTDGPSPRVAKDSIGDWHDDFRASWRVPRCNDAPLSA
jgi:hypothetical protein